MRKPMNIEFGLAHAWLDHFEVFWAWEEMDRLIAQDRPGAVRMVQILVAYAPDEGALGCVAAGPVEELFAVPFFLEEAKTNPRLRICLGMTNGLPENLVPFADRCSRTDSLPPMTPIDATPEEIRLMVGYFHYYDTFWAANMLEELTRRHPDEALSMLSILLDLTRHEPHLRREIFSHGFELFIELNFGNYRKELKELAHKYDDLRQYFLLMRSCRIDNPADWTEFIRVLGT